MYVVESGTGETVLLLHGTPQPAADWEPLVRALARNHRILVPELPGYGRSPAPADASMESVGDAIASMLRERGAQRLRAVVGFSTGAYRAFDLVLRHPLEVGVLVSLAGVVAFDDAARALRTSFAAQLAGDPAFLASGDVRAVMRDLMLSPTWRDRHPEDVAHVEAWPTATSAVALAAELHALAASRDLRPELPSLRCPVYARVGSLDVGCPPAWSEDIARLVPRATLDIVPGCGHALLLEDRDATIAAVCRVVEDAHA